VLAPVSICAIVAFVMDSHRIAPGSKVDLARINPKDSSLYPKLTKEEHHQPLDDLRQRLKEQQHLLYAGQHHRLLVIVQAMDTGGKDGLARHVFAHLDPQGVDVIPFKAPTADELSRDFLWRIHRHCPPAGRIAVFNRSHYEDVVAVRVKKLFPDAVWKRRYRHIVEFERMLVEEGTTIVKIFLHISKEEQKRRLESRLAEPRKHWKFNPEDLKDRARWGDFLAAYGDVIERTSTSFAPWHVIPADRKWYRNLLGTRLMVETLAGLDLAYPAPTFDPAEVRVV
jgi:PPK2 family polyphosphate:nucleotide phosphotransferase